MYTLVTFATHWGSKFGGINSFNADFVAAFGVAYHLKSQVICIVPHAGPEAVEEAAKSHVLLISLLQPPHRQSALTSSHGEAGLNRLRDMNLSFEPDMTIWLGHDRFTGEAAIAAAKIAGGRSAVIQHMSYAYYETYAADSRSAQEKSAIQANLLGEADVILTVGPLLRYAAKDLVASAKPVHMLIPGLAEIEPQPNPHAFVAFMSARLSDDAARIKQGRLGVAAFAKAQREARDEGRPAVLLGQPKLVLRGVALENHSAASSAELERDPETELKQFAEEYAQGVVNLDALPYLEDRNQLHTELRRASVALMPSWHEGFGLAAWEAIAAGVPLIISKNSGVYQFLDEEYAGAGTGCVYAIIVDGAIREPFFTERDLDTVVRLLKTIADDPGKARKQASILRNMVGDYTWAACSAQAVAAFGWELEKGSVPAITSEMFADTSTSGPVPIATEKEEGPLQIPVSKWRPGVGMADSQLLRAEEALLEFDAARLPDVEKLNEWLDNPTWPLAVRLITGAGGSGKTRLALEVCQRRCSRGWYAGFLNSNQEASTMPAAWRSITIREQPVLIVVDYSETRQSLLLALLRAALQSPSNQAVRVLLLARDGGEWWDNLPSKDPQCEALLNGYAAAGPFELPPLYRAEDARRTAYSKALAAFAQTLGASAPVVEPDLSASHFKRPLYVQIAALLALYGEQPTTAHGLTRALLNHERRYWAGVLADLNCIEPERCAEQLLALTTLAGGFDTPNVALPFWNAVHAGVLTTGDFNSLFRKLATLYPGVQGLQALRPDLLGEALVAQALLRPNCETILDAVLASTATHFVRRQALTVLARVSNQRADIQEILVGAFLRHFHSCYEDIVAVSKETRSHLPEIAEVAFEGLAAPMKRQVAGLLEPLLREESVELARLSCKVDEYLVEKHRGKWKKKPSDLDRMAGYAVALISYAVSLSRAGQFEEACEFGAKSIELYRRLSARRDEYNYALSLSNYAGFLSDVGRHEEALGPGRQAVENVKRLVSINPNRYEAGYAWFLNNYASHLSDLEEYEDALKHCREAVEIYGRLAPKNASQFDPDYAWSLTTCSILLGRLGQTDEALERSHKALELFKRLVQKNPDRFEPDYSLSLQTYADRMNERGDYEKAIDHASAALKIRKRLAQKNPNRFESDYVGALNRYAGELVDVGRYRDAFEAAVQALEIGRRLAQQTPIKFSDGLFQMSCSASFWGWLIDPPQKIELPNADVLLSFIPPNKHHSLLFFQAFASGCMAPTQIARQEHFRVIFTHWDNLVKAHKTLGEPEWLCASAWCAKYDREFVDNDWKSRWFAYVKQRKGRTPQWMQTVASRLEFEWPSLSA